MGFNSIPFDTQSECMMMGSSTTTVAVVARTARCLASCSASSRGVNASFSSIIIISMPVIHE